MGRCTTRLCGFSPWIAEKSKFSKLIFLDIVITYNDHPRYVKHVLGRIYMFFTIFGFWAHRTWSPKGLLHNLPILFFTVSNSNIEVFET